MGLSRSLSPLSPLSRSLSLSEADETEERGRGIIRLVLSGSDIPGRPLSEEPPIVPPIVPPIMPADSTWGGACEEAEVVVVMEDSLASW